MSFWLSHRCVVSALQVWLCNPIANPIKLAQVGFPINRFPINRFPINRFPINRFQLNRFHTSNLDSFRHILTRMLTS